MKNLLKLSLSVFLIIIQNNLYAVSATLIRDTIVDSQALTLTGGSWGDIINGVSFQQDAVVSHNGWQYAAYYNGARHVCVARRQLPAGSWQILELTDYNFASTDAHNVISMGICPNDGTIHLSFDHHGSTLHYRKSITGAATNPTAIVWEAALFEPTRNYLEAGKSVSGVTYPRFWQTPSGNLQMYYRYGGSGNGDSFLVDYDASDGKWKNTRMVISRTGSYSDLCGTSTVRNAYMNYPFYDSFGVLHWTWCWRESAGGTNHDICYAYSPDGGYTWYNSNVPEHLQIKTGTGSSLQTLLNMTWTSTMPQIIGKSTGSSSTELLIRVDTPGIVVVPITRYFSLMNQQSQAIDPQGRVHTVMYYETNGAGCDIWAGDAYHHYWRDTDGTWNHTQLPITMGSRPKLFFRGNGDLFMIYLRSGKVYVAAATASTKWTDWKNLGSASNYYYAGEGAGDNYRIRQDGILSVMAQVAPASAGQSTPLHILDWQLN